MKLHLGCWKRYIPGFVHVDLFDMPHIDYVSSVDALPMFEDGVADLVYSSHLLEYWDRQEAPRVLEEWRRVLKPGGVLRLAVPDFDALIKVYERSGDLNKILGPLFGHMDVVSSNNEHSTIYHKTVYNFESLQALLDSVGFRDVRRYDWQKTIHKDYDDHSQAYFPHMDKDNGLLISLNVEATK